MIRKAIIVVLTLGAVGTGAAMLCSLSSPVLLEYNSSSISNPLLRRPLVTRKALTYIKGGILDCTRVHLVDKKLQVSAQARKLGGFCFEQSVRRVLRPRHRSPGQRLDLPSQAEKLEAKRLWAKKQVTTRVQIPLWCPFTLLGAYPTVAFIHGPLRRRRRRRKGLCIKCGYNLTGNVTGVCPECGIASTPP